ncbi:ependymin-like 1 [Neosynchiropus ocellatus]
MDVRVLAVLLCAVVGGLALKPRRCYSPPLLSGALTVATQNEQVWAYSRYMYDALGQRIRLHEFGVYQNETFTLDVLLLYRESIMFEIDRKAQTCKKRPLQVDFQPLAIPQNASFLGQAVVGGSSGPGQGLLVNTWVGLLPNNAGRYLTTVTEFGCIPVSISYQTPQYGWMVLSYFNNVIGLIDPNELNPPAFCMGDSVQVEEKPGHFFSAFLKN